jgi:hypothetical protein
VSGDGGTGRRGTGQGGTSQGGAGEQRDMLDVLSADHSAMGDLVAQLERVAGSRGEESRRLVRRLIGEMVSHVTAEEEYLYPAIRRAVPDGDGLAGHEILEHQRAMEIMKRLERLRASQIDFWPTVHELVAQIRQHERQQALETFPAVRQHVSEHDLRELGPKVEHAKRTAPIRPHPGEPYRPPLNRLTAPLLRWIDRIRGATEAHRSRDGS